MKSLQRAVLMSQTSAEFRKGFSFAINCMLDQAKNKENATLESIIKFLEGTNRLINNNSFWEPKNAVPDV